MKQELLDKYNFSILFLEVQHEEDITIIAVNIIHFKFPIIIYSFVNDKNY